MMLPRLVTMKVLAVKTAMPLKYDAGHVRLMLLMTVTCLAF